MTLNLNESTRRRCADALASLPSPYSHLEADLDRLSTLFPGLLPAEVRAALRDVGAGVGPSALHLTGLPIDERLPPTPSDGREPSGKLTYTSEAIALGLGQLLGHVIAYRAEKHGDVIQQVIPLPGGEGMRTNEGSRQPLGWHVDLTYDPCGRFHVFAPDHTILIGVRTSPTQPTRTHVADVKRALQHVRCDLKPHLRTRSYRLSAPGTVCRAAGRKIWSCPTALIAGPADLPEVRLAASGVQPAGEESARAHAALLDALNKVREDVVLQPGTALVVCNRRAVHAREAFNPCYGDSERWIQRVHSRRDVWPLRHRRVGSRTY